LNNLKEFLYQHSSLTILSFFTKHKSRQFSALQIAELCNLPLHETQDVLESLCKLSIINRHLNQDEPTYDLQEELLYVQAFQMFDDAVELSELVKQIKERCRKIVLLDKSKDVDSRHDEHVYLFIQMDQNNHRYIQDSINKMNFDRTIKPIILSTQEILELTLENPMYLHQLNAGIILWEK